MLLFLSLVLRRGCRVDALGGDHRALISSEATVRNSEMHIRGSGCSVEISSNVFVSGLRVLLLGSGCRAVIGESCLIAGDVCIICDNDYSSVVMAQLTQLFGPLSVAATEGIMVELGESCMVAPSCSLRSGDSHAIYKDGIRTNPAKDIRFGSSFWLGERVMILKGIEIEADSVVAACSVVTKPFTQPSVVLAGVPARIVNEGIFWKTDL